MTTATHLTLDMLKKAKQALEANDDYPPDDRLICYEWEAKFLIERGYHPSRLVVTPTKIPGSK